MNVAELSAKVGELLDRVLGLEKSEFCLKSQLWEQEKKAKELEIKVGRRRVLPEEPAVGTGEEGEGTGD